MGFVEDDVTGLKEGIAIGPGPLRNSGLISGILNERLNERINGIALGGDIKTVGPRFSQKL